MLGHIEYDTEAQKSEAIKVFDILNAAYPGYPWSVTVKGGIVFMRHLLGVDPPQLSTYGMNLKFNNINHDAAVMKREIITMAGEWLERSGLVRSRWNEDEPDKIEGVPEKHQIGYRPPIEMEVVIGEAEQRTSVRPQVEELVKHG